MDSENLFPPNLVIRTFESGPYLTPVAALCEIIDNSYDAEAGEIHIALISRKTEPGKNRLHTVAVLDNGNGMSKNVLKYCIQHGHHIAQPRKRRKGSSIGKFGVGLVQASFNQCTHLQVYSWDNGLDKAEIPFTELGEDCKDHKVPELKEGEFPEFVKVAFQSFPEDHYEDSGTLVVWKLKKELKWRTAKKWAAEAKLALGRVYRNFLNHTLTISISCVEETADGSFEVTSREDVEPVDPLFLKHWNCDALREFGEAVARARNNPEHELSESDLAGVKDTPLLFRPYNIENPQDPSGWDKDGNPVQQEYAVQNPETGKVIGRYRITAAYRYPKLVRAVGGRNPGSTSYGRLADKLRGVSFLRGGREITLDPNWFRSDNTVARWFGVSFDFDPSLDEVFGVSNDKQRAQNLLDLASQNLGELNPNDGSYEPAAIAAAKHISNILSKLDRLVASDKLKQKPKDDPSNLHVSPSSEETSNLIDLTIRVQKDPSQRIEKIDGKEATLADKPKLTAHYEGTEFEYRDAASERPSLVIKNKLGVDFVTDPSRRSFDFFSFIDTDCGSIVVLQNPDHPVYRLLKRISDLPDTAKAEQETELEKRVEELEEQAEVLKEKIKDALWLNRVMLYGFARATLNSSQADQIMSQELRGRWSKALRIMLGEED